MTDTFWQYERVGDTSQKQMSLKVKQDYTNMKQHRRWQEEPRARVVKKQGEFATLSSTQEGGCNFAQDISLLVLMFHIGCSTTESLDVMERPKI